TEASLPALRKQLAQQRHALAALSGTEPGLAIEEAITLDLLHLPAELPVSLPSQLVRQRPDVRAAEAELHSASAQVGIATATMLPQFAITASGGYAADRFAGLLAGSNAFWSIAAGVTQPLFAGGTLLHRKRAAEAAYEQAAAQYRSTVLAALQNAADTLAALRWDAEGLRAAVRAEEAAARTLAIARRQLELGDIGYPALLVANLAYQQAVLARVQAQASRYADTAALFQAMGGGWWNRAASSGEAPA